jgi:hypothetical protein
MRRLGFALITVGGFALGVHGCKKSKAPGEEQSCPDGSAVVVVDCRTVVTYDARKVEVELGVKDWAQAGLSTSKEVLRMVTDGFAQADQEYVQACQMYNACALPAAAFQEGVRRSQEREREVRACLTLAEAGGAQGHRDALSCLHRAAVPPEKDTSLALSFVVQAQRGGAEQVATLGSGETLRTGDKMVFGLTLNKPAHVYMMQRTGPQRRLEVLFPNAAITTLTNPLPASQLIRMPPEGKSFRVNEEDIGLEEVFIIASEEPIGDLAGALDALSHGGGGATEQVSERVGSLFQEERPGCEDKSRGLEIVDDECPRSRGLTIDDDGAGADPFFAGQPASLRVRADPWDDTIVQVFTFQHAN